MGDNRSMVFEENFQMDFSVHVVSTNTATAIQPGDLTSEVGIANFVFESANR